MANGSAAGLLICVIVEPEAAAPQLSSSYGCE